jgi:hypothetical protein
MPDDANVRARLEAIPATPHTRQNPLVVTEFDAKPANVSVHRPHRDTCGGTWRVVPHLVHQLVARHD